MKNKGLIFVVITAFAFATLEPVSKLIANDVAPMSMTFLRFFVGSALLLPFSFIELKKREIKLTAKDFGLMSFLGVLCICVSMVLLQYAVKISATPAVVAIVFSANSVFTIAFAAFILGEKVTKNKIIAIVLCLIGLVICSDFTGKESGNALLSVALAVLSALSFSLYTVLSKKYTKKLSGIIQTGFSFFAGSIVLLPILMLCNEKPLAWVYGDNVVTTLLVLLYLAAVVTGIGYFAYFKALEMSGAATASLAFFIKPVLAPIAMLLIQGTVPTPKVYIAVVFVIAGSYISTLDNKKK